MKNLIAFFEIPAIDFRRAVDFYEFVLKVKLSVAEYEEEKMACFMVEDKAVGAVFEAPGFRPSKDGVLIHFYCEEIEKALERAVSKGGEIIIPITGVEADCKGSFAVFADSEGNHIGLYTEK